MADVLAPQRPRLDEALACVTEHDAAWWSAAITLHGPKSVRWDDGHGACVYCEHCRHPPARSDNAIGCVGDVTITDPREAWEVLTERLGLAGWLDDSRRRFVCHACDGWFRELTSENLERGMCATCAGLGWRVRQPTTVAACVAIASDVANILTVEAIAREITGRDTMVWRVTSPDDVRRTRTTAVSPGRDGHDGRPWDTELSERARPIAVLGYALDAVTDEAVRLVCPAL